MQQLRIGTLVHAGEALDHVPQLVRHGFESFSLTFWATTRGVDLEATADALQGRLGSAVVSSLGIFGNPLLDDEDGEEARASWRRLIAVAPLFGTDLVGGFTGRLPGPIEASLPRYARVFGELGAFAADHGVRLCFENCAMDGTWADGSYNIAHGPAAWELMWNALPLDHLGLEWEPCHQLLQLVDPLPQLRTWAPKVFHVHGKDATVAWDVVREHGVHGPKPFAWQRTPGFGDTNWTDVISVLRMNGYAGTIDIEGWHDPVYRGDLEMTGQVHALHHLKRCRGGDFVPNPTRSAVAS